MRRGKGGGGEGGNNGNGKEGGGEEGGEEGGEGEEEGEEEEEFKLLSAAWELLGSEEKRRQYDSLDYFNDALPTAFRPRADDPGRFFRVFGPVFARQAKFSVARPVPSVGDDETPLEAVQHFYAFWTRFRSWRDFSLLAECDTAERRRRSSREQRLFTPRAVNRYDTAEAEDREERRWMQRQNKNEVERLKRSEMRRLMSAVELAQENDPRLHRAREERAAERELQRRRKEEALAAEKRAKAEAAEQARAAEAAAAAAAAAERASKDSDKAAAKREKEKARSALKKARKELKSLGEEGAAWRARASDLEAVASGLPLGEIEALHATLSAGDDAAGTDALEAALRKVLG